MLRGLVVGVCVAAASSCTTALRTIQEARTETKLSAGEKRHMAGLLNDMAQGWDGMRRGRAAQRRAAQDRYTTALGHFLRYWDDSQSPRYWRNGTVFANAEHAFSIEFDTQADQRSEVPPPHIDDIILPHRVRSRLDDTLAHRPGVGVPFVGHVRRTKATRKEQPFLPPNGGNYTLTALMEFDAPPGGPATPRACRVRFHNALNVDTVKLGEDDRLLAANFTAAKNLALARKSLGPFSFLGLLYPERTLAECQLYMMDFYDPNRIPVVFVHGLMSDPHIWLNVVNAISADKELRAAYQPWYFLYPTALGIPRSSSSLRDSLADAIQRMDPEHNDDGLKKMVLVGHSMGGLLSRMQVIDPKDTMARAMLGTTPDKLRVSHAVEERLVHNLMFKPQPHVRRLVFIATPHRGSNLASFNIVRRLASLIRLPVDTLKMSQELLSGNTGAISSDLRDWGIYGFVSLGMLSEKHPFYQGLNALPIPVRHHSIIGDAGRGNTPNSTDLVVPYWSSHLATAQSEKIVPYWHGCVERPETVQEVIRVLREHLRENGKPRKQR
ncbi:MAG: esterase/lipase family protein [Prosthecobacter sp.]